jgi:hypothetical protein
MSLTPMPGPVGIPDDESRNTYIALCCASLAGAALSVIVGTRAIVGFQTRLRNYNYPSECLSTSYLSRRNIYECSRNRQLEVQRFEWIRRLRNPLSRFMLSAIMIQIVQALAVVVFAIIALARPNTRCYVVSPTNTTTATMAPHVISSHACDLSSVLDEFLDTWGLLMIAFYLALIAFPFLHSHEPRKGNLQRQLCFVLGWILSLVFAAAWTSIAYTVMPQPQPARSKFHRLLPWCWSPGAVVTDGPWSVARFAVPLIVIGVYVILGTAAIFRLRNALRQYRKAAVYRWGDQYNSTPLASFIRSKELPRRIRALPILYVLLLTINAIWRLVPFDTTGSDLALGILCLFAPCNAAVTSVLWATCEGVFIELYVPRGPRCCGRGGGGDEGGSSSGATDALVVLEPVPFTHIVLTANRFIERFADEQRWLHLEQVPSGDGSSERQEEPSQVLTTGPAPVP